MLRENENEINPIIKNPQLEQFNKAKSAKPERISHNKNRTDISDLLNMRRSKALEHHNRNETHNLGDLENSCIADTLDEQIMILKWVQYKATKIELLYNASVDGFSASEFHNRCDNKGKTLLLFRSESGNKFGGYTPLIWDKSDQWKEDLTYQTFVFSLDNKKHFKIGPHKKAIYCSSKDGPSFGSGHDIFISSDANINSESYSNFGYSFPSASAGFSLNSERSRAYLAGSYTFKILAFEVYQLS
jgi:hypothetical protein